MGVDAGEMEIGSSSEQLRHRLMRELPTRLAALARADEADGRPAMEDAQRRARVEKTLSDVAEEHARMLLTRGESLVAPDVEQQVIAAVLAEVLGLAGLEPLLRNPDIENININGDRVFVRYADGRRE
ncbi:hypothetical protein QQY66_48760 [Streptomyces sp. DG2A-72]|uniref:hypothetical protein n=1 Tax=Streptomyces sp. DG2A-72 TaxID=3051386 RepID=UPI00265BAF95|nr:hypothetical protein [Streptomyces sp. DG2A-72]MDO0939210.1 hypothetical protein [Streptomyces sp. DG2A-72]